MTSFNIAQIHTLIIIRHLGHQSDVKSVDWHPYRALIASASRDATLRLWDPRQEAIVR